MLYMPGSNARALEKGKGLPADALILDLEDAVAPDAKSTAREQVVAATREGGYGYRELLIRTNPLSSPWGYEDLRAAAKSGADAVLLPKVESASMVHEALAVLDSAGAPTDLAVWCMMETPRGILRAEDREAARAEVEALQRLLAGLDRKMNGATPALAEATARLAREQAAMLEPTQEARAISQQVAEQMPMGAPGLVESMDGALREMERAEGALELARAVEAEGAERATADRIRQAIEALAQAGAAMQQLQEAMAQAMEGTGGAGERRDGEEGGDGDEDSRDIAKDIELPDPEEFRTPEEYRQALLEGMRDEVPPEYRALKRRYYEELVRQ